MSILSTQLDFIFNNPCVIWDTETTGGGREDEIIEISIINLYGSVLFSSLIKPTKPINRFAQETHGIQEHELCNAPPIKAVSEHISYILQNNISIAFNSVFDVRLLEQSYNRYNLVGPRFVENICLMKLYKEYCGKITSLENACLHFGLQPGKHRALSDCRAKLRLLNKLKEVTPSCQEVSKNPQYIHQNAVLGNGEGQQIKGLDLLIEPI